MSRAQTRKVRAMVDLGALFVATAVLVLVYTWYQDFYELPIDARIDHDRYDDLKSGGTIGRWLGTTAVVFFFLNLLYAVRRRMRVLRKLGHLRSWMTAHMLFGLLGGGLIALHATFEIRSEAAKFSAYAVIVLVVTGIIGRYIYALVPHTATGEEEPKGLHGRTEQSLRALRDQLGADHPLVTEITEKSQVNVKPERNLIKALLRIPGEPLRRVSASVALSKHLDALKGEWSGAALESIESDAREALHSGQAYQLAGATSRILRSWRNIHLFFALVMAYTAYAHIRSAFEVGFGWNLPDPLWPWGLAALSPFLLAVALEIDFRRKRRRPKVKQEASDDPPPAPPPTLHPYIDPNVCMGSGSCVQACPEGDILSMLDARSRLTEPSLCVGHGECYRGCPVQAITLVFGNFKRGVDIPEVSQHFESSVPGIYLIGELTGMGLIRNAVRQANQAMAHLAKQRKSDKGSLPDGMVDVCIVGAGPAGIAASLGCIERGMTYVTLEQEKASGGAVNHYPRRKLVMTEPMHLPIYGKVRMWDVTKEELVELWDDVRAKTGYEVRTGVKVDNCESLGEGKGFRVVVKGGDDVLARRVLLAVGRRGTPRKLGVPGEESAKVMYSLLEPDQFAGRKMAVTGGGDSALESVLSLVEAGAEEVHLIYRRDSFDRAKKRNQQRIAELAGAGTIKLHLKKNIGEITDGTIVLKECGTEIANDEVVVCVGGTLPTGLLKSAGVQVSQHFGRPME